MNTSDLQTHLAEEAILSARVNQCVVAPIDGHEGWSFKTLEIKTEGLRVLFYLSDAQIADFKSQVAALELKELT